ncbi:MAG: hypothetical protein ICV62_16295, partial [Cyanobacteria bacterium Co-bin13]|nr:hypothetical protein [Cyanobacteria bacterium Co-bin13]
MSKPEMDLQAIREKLLNQRQQYGPSAAEEAPVDWSSPRARTSIPTKPSPAAPSPQLVNAVETLRQRSNQGATGQLPLAPDAVSWSPDLEAQINLHQQRLQAIVEQINDLSDRQERAMLDMKAVAE